MTERGSAWVLTWLIAAYVVSALVFFTPGAVTPQPLTGLDKFVHTTMFALLTVPTLLRGHRLSSVLAVTFCYAVASEIVQAFAIPNRSGSLGDIAADSIGILLGTAIWWHLPAHEESITLPD